MTKSVHWFWFIFCWRRTTSSYDLGRVIFNQIHIKFLSLINKGGFGLFLKKGSFLGILKNFLRNLSFLWEELTKQLIYLLLGWRLDLLVLTKTTWNHLRSPRSVLNDNKLLNLIILTEHLELWVGRVISFLLFCWQRDVLVVTSVRLVRTQLAFLFRRWDFIHL